MLNEINRRRDDQARHDRRKTRLAPGIGITVGGHTVTFHATLHGLVTFECSHPVDQGWGHTTAACLPGNTPCVHAAKAARRLRRSGLITGRTGVWAVR